MKLFFFTEGRFIKKDGEIYSLTGEFSYKLWERYLFVFSEIVVVARVKTDNFFTGDFYKLASNKNVSFVELPYYVGPWQFLKAKKTINTILTNIIKSNHSSYLCRLPGTIGGEAIKILQKRNIPYGCEVVGNPWDVFAPGTIKHPLRPFLRIYSTSSLKNYVCKSSCTLYVTQHTLQKMYPSRKKAYETYASDVEIDINNISHSPHILTDKKIIDLVAIGSLEQLYKAPDIVLKAIKQLNEEGIYCNLTWLGDGFYKYQMIELANQLNIKEKVIFKGNVSKEDVLNTLNNADIYIHVSRTEGLPRAIIEAMSCGLPCIGSNVGGIPELLDKDTIIPKNDIHSLTQKIKEMVTNKEFTNKMAEINLAKAHEFTRDILTKKRIEFFNQLLKVSKE